MPDMRQSRQVCQISQTSYAGPTSYASEIGQKYRLAKPGGDGRPSDPSGLDGPDGLGGVRISRNSLLVVVNGRVRG